MAQGVKGLFLACWAAEQVEGCSQLMWTLYSAWVLQKQGRRQTTKLSLQPHKHNPASIRECIRVKQTEWGTGQHTETVCLFLRHFLTDGLTTTPALERLMLPWVVRCISRFFQRQTNSPERAVIISALHFRKDLNTQSRAHINAHTCTHLSTTQKVMWLV